MSSRPSSGSCYNYLVSAVHSEQSFTTQTTQKKVDERAQQYANSATSNNFEHLMSARKELHLHLAEISKSDLARCKPELFEQRDKEGRFSAMLAQHD